MTLPGFPVGTTWSHTWACSAAAAPPSLHEDLRPVLPFDTRTGKLNDELWSRWLALNPVRMAPEAGEALRSLPDSWVDAGTREEWYLDLGTAKTLGPSTDGERFRSSTAGIVIEVVLFLRAHVSWDFQARQAGTQR